MNAGGRFGSVSVSFGSDEEDGEGDGGVMADWTVREGLTIMLVVVCDVILVEAGRS